MKALGVSPSSQIGKQEPARQDLFRRTPFSPTGSLSAWSRAAEGISGSRKPLRHSTTSMSAHECRPLSSFWHTILPSVCMEAGLCRRSALFAWWRGIL